MSDLPTIEDRHALIVIYHYLHTPGEGIVDGLRGVTPVEFAGQLNALAQRMPFATLSQLLDPDSELPSLVAVITFDDGLADVPNYALPILEQMGIPATIFVCSAPYMDQRVLLVHKIHLLQAKLGQEKFQASVNALLPSLEEIELDDPVQLGIGNLYLYDDDITRDFKTLLNYRLPYPLVERVLDELFEETFGDQRAWAARLYASLDDLRDCARRGHEIGTHSHSHHLLSRLPPAEQQRELESDRAFLARELGQLPQVHAYPYGNQGTWNSDTKRLLKEWGFAGAVTLGRRIVKPKDINSRWEIPRFNANDVFDHQGNLNNTLLELLVVDD